VIFSPTRNTYRADAGFERTAIRSDAGFAVDNLDLVGVFAEGGILEDEVRAGLFDGAEIRISFVNWQDPDGHGEIRLRRGTLEVFSPNCRADLGDARCKFPIEPPELGRDEAVSEGAFYRVPTAAGTGSARYEDRLYEVIEAGTTASSQPAYDSGIGATTIDGTATLKAYDSFTRVGFVESVTDHRIFTVSEDLSPPPPACSTAASARRTSGSSCTTSPARTKPLTTARRAPPRRKATTSRAIPAPSRPSPHRPKSPRRPSPPHAPKARPRRRPSRPRLHRPRSRRLGPARSRPR
jgi:hypothetical protein